MDELVASFTEIFGWKDLDDFYYYAEKDESGNVPFSYDELVELLHTDRLDKLKDFINEQETRNTTRKEIPSAIQ